MLKTKTKSTQKQQNKYNTYTKKTTIRHLLTNSKKQKKTRNILIIQRYRTDS